jgi:hypothetical protein
MLQKGNELWKLRKNPGKKKTFKTPQQLWQQACEYFEWVEENPLEEEREYAGKITKIKRKRPFTLAGLCVYLNVSKSTLENYKKKYPEYERIMEKINQICYVQKLEGAAVGIFQHNIIARELGLTDKIQADVVAHTEAPDLSKLSNEEVKLLTGLQKKLLHG